MADIHDPNYSRRRFLQAAGGSLAAAPLLGAVSPAAAQVPDIRLPEVPGAEGGMGARRDRRADRQPDPPGLPEVPEVEGGLLRQRTPGEGGAVRPGPRGRSEEHLHLRELRQDRRQPGHPGRLHRAAQQHARRVHDPGAQGRQARAVREADGQHRGRLREDDRGGQGGEQEADGGLSLPLRAQQPARHQMGAGLSEGPLRPTPGSPALGWARRASSSPRWASTSATRASGA